MIWRNKILCFSQLFKVPSTQLPLHGHTVLVLLNINNKCQPTYSRLTTVAKLSFTSGAEDIIDNHSLGLNVSRPDGAWMIFEARVNLQSNSLYM